MRGIDDGEGTGRHLLYDIRKQNLLWTKGTIRISFGSDNVEDDAEVIAKALIDILQRSVDKSN